MTQIWWSKSDRAIIEEVYFIVLEKNISTVYILVKIPIVEHTKNMLKKEINQHRIGKCMILQKFSEWFSREPFWDKYFLTR